MNLGYIFKVRCYDAIGNAIDDRDPHVRPAVVDVLCQKSADSSDLLCSRTNGCELVALDVTDSLGSYPKITKCPTSGTESLYPFGVVLPDQGRIGNNALCWVRWKGLHSYAAVDGTTDVAHGDALATHGSTAGAMIKQGTNTNIGSICRAKAARTTNSISALAVLLRPQQAW